MSIRDHVVLLVGGVGGARLAVGLAAVLPPEALRIIVNTGDDFEHLGLHISPDLDTVMYSLAGLANPITGWGLEGDTFRVMEGVARYGGPTWFRLGDQDLATGIMRTAMLREGQTLTAITRHLSERLGIGPRVLPMCDDDVRTELDTDRGLLAFQEYFVREQWQPLVRRINFRGAAQARPSPEVTAALAEAGLIVFGPSNPYLSIDPILAVPGIRDQIKAARAPRIAVSPIVAGQAIKGPAAKLMTELGHEVSAAGVARYYEGLIDGIIIDSEDHDLSTAIEAVGIRVRSQPSVMKSNEEKARLASDLLRWAEGGM